MGRSFRRMSRTTVSLPSRMGASVADGEAGYSDFGLWNVSYEAVDCLEDWAGGGDQAALGSVPNMGSRCVSLHAHGYLLVLNDGLVSAVPPIRV